MRRVDKLSVRRPAVALQDAGVVGAEHPGGLRKPAPVFNGVGGGGRRGKRPQPVRVAADLPAGFVGRDDRTAADLGAQRLIRRLRVARGPMHRVHQSAARDAQAEAIAEQGDDPAKGKAALFVEEHGEGDRLGAQLHGGRAKGIGGLQRMPALHAPPTRSAVADRDAKLVNDGPLHRQVFLVLRDDPAATHRPAAIRTDVRQRRFMPDIDVHGQLSMRFPAVGRARLAARSLGVFFRQAARKGRRLAVRAPTRHLKFFLQPLVLAPQPIAFDLRALQVLFQPLNAARLIVDDLARITGRRRVLWRSRHATVMPD